MTGLRRGGGCSGGGARSGEDSFARETVGEGVAGGGRTTRGVPRVPGMVLEATHHRKRQLEPGHVCTRPPRRAVVTIVLVAKHSSDNNQALAADPGPVANRAHIGYQGRRLGLIHLDLELLVYAGRRAEEKHEV